MYYFILYRFRIVWWYQKMNRLCSTHQRIFLPYVSDHSLNMNTHIGYSPCLFHLDSWQLTTTHCGHRSLESWAVTTHWVNDVKSSVCQYCVARNKIVEERTMLCDISITCSATPSIGDKTNCALRCLTNEVFDSVVIFILWIWLGSCQQPR